MASVALAAAAAAAIATRGDGPVEQRPVGPPTVMGGTAAERALVRRLLRGYGTRRRLARVEIGVPPRRFGRSGEARWLEVTAPGTLEPASEVEAAWQADMLLGAIRRRASTSFRGVTFRLLLPDGDVREGSAVAGRQLSLSRRLTQAQVVPLIERSAARAGVRVDEIWFLRLDALAVGARLVTEDAEAFVCDGERHLATLTRPFVRHDESTGIEGVFLDVRAEDGEGVLAFGGALGGHLQVRDDLWERYPPQTADPDVRARQAELCAGR